MKIRLLATLATIVAPSSWSVLAGGFSYSCYNYYLDNGIADGSGELFIEAFCAGRMEYLEMEDGTLKTGEKPPLCSRLDIQDCYKNVNGMLQAYSPEEVPNSDVTVTCDIRSCAMLGDVWDGPILTCFCQGDNGRWVATSVNLSQKAFTPRLLLFMTKETKESAEDHPREERRARRRKGTVMLVESESVATPPKTTLSHSDDEEYVRNIFVDTGGRKYGRVRSEIPESEK
ncbi:hypothetical protein VM1G_04784 [Cytospora mali]|uniref:Cyanovirin-N domain-containing protein n=1 Tax=Cytospora mali TaxID=578113 RepID=A0A194W0R0_CYTMA|nr:hypothetical protein VM1G_04784 [Valsa mali]